MDPEVDNTGDSQQQEGEYDNNQYYPDRVATLRGWQPASAMRAPDVTGATGDGHVATAFPTLPAADHCSADSILKLPKAGPLGVGSASR